MIGEYKRETKIIDLPSGKKVHIVTYFSNWETEEIQKQLIKGKKQGEMSDKPEDIDAESMIDSYRKARELGITKLIDKDGKEYEATEATMRSFISSEDSETLDKFFTDMMSKKKIKKKS